MAKVVNPFIVTGKIEPEYFCDRIQETIWLLYLPAVWVKRD